MTKQELKTAFEVANSEKELQQTDLLIFDGFGLPEFEKVNVTIEAVAKLIRWQCIRLDGSVDQEELNTIAEIGKRKFFVIG